MAAYDTTREAWTKNIPLTNYRVNRGYGVAYDPTRWFKDDRIQLNFGDSVGRPAVNSTMQKEYLVKFLENGWKIERVLTWGEEGEWRQLTESESSSVSSELVGRNGSEEGSTRGTSNGTNEERTESDTGSTTVNVDENATNKNSTTSDTGMTTSRELGNSTNVSDATGKTKTKAESKSSSENTGTTSRSTTDTSEQNGESSTRSTQTSGGSPFWCAWMCVVLVRRRMQAELVMRDILNSFTLAHNDGKRIEDTLLNAMLVTYSELVRMNEAEANALVDGAQVDGVAIVESFKASSWKDLDEAGELARAMAKSAEKDAVDDIMRKFAEAIGAARAKMISEGTYNSTTWPSVEANMTRECEVAIRKARIDAKTSAANVLVSVGSAKASAASALHAALSSAQNAIDNRRVTATELRNSAVKWMVDFIGNHREVYPTLEEMSSVAQALGFSAGTSGNIL